MMLGIVVLMVLLGALVSWLITITSAIAGKVGVWIFLGLLITCIGALFYCLMEEC